MEEAVPIKPSQKLQNLVKIGVISSISVEYRQTGTDTAATYVTLKGWHGTVAGLWSEYEHLINVAVGYNSVAQIRPACREQVEKWAVFAKRHSHELAEYQRLKAKFEGVKEDAD